MKNQCFNQCFASEMVPQALFFWHYLVPKELPTKSYPKITQNAAKRPHQQNGALRAPFLPAFFVAFCANFGTSWFVTLSVKNNKKGAILASYGHNR